MAANNYRNLLEYTDPSAWKRAHSFTRECMQTRKEMQTGDILRVQYKLQDSSRNKVMITRTLTCREVHAHHALFTDAHGIRTCFTYPEIVNIRRGVAQDEIPAP